MAWLLNFVLSVDFLHQLCLQVLPNHLSLPSFMASSSRICCFMTTSYSRKPSCAVIIITHYQIQVFFGRGSHDPCKTLWFIGPQRPIYIPSFLSIAQRHFSTDKNMYTSLKQLNHSCQMHVCWRYYLICNIHIYSPYFIVVKYQNTKSAYLANFTLPLGVIIIITFQVKLLFFICGRLVLKQRDILVVSCSLTCWSV